MVLLRRWGWGRLEEAAWTDGAGWCQSLPYTAPVIVFYSALSRLLGGAFGLTGIVHIGS